MSTIPKANLSFYTHIYNEYSIEEYNLNNSLENYYSYLSSVVPKVEIDGITQYTIPIVFHVLGEDHPDIIIAQNAVNNMVNALNAAFGHILKFRPALRNPDGDELDVPGLNINSNTELTETRIDDKGEMQTYTYKEHGITMHTEDPNIFSTQTSQGNVHLPVPGINHLTLKNEVGFDPHKYFNVYLVNYLRDQADVPNSLLASSINPVIAVKNGKEESFGVIVPYYSLPEDNYITIDDKYLSLSYWSGMGSYIWLLHAVGNSLGLVTTSNYRMDYIQALPNSEAFFAMSAHSDECLKGSCIFKDAKEENNTNKHSGPCLSSEESIPFDVFKNNALEPLDCEGKPLKVDNIVAGIYPYARILDLVPDVTKEQLQIIVANLFIDFTSELEIVGANTEQIPESPPTSDNLNEGSSSTVHKIGILHALINSSAATPIDPATTEPCEIVYPYTADDIIGEDMWLVSYANSNLETVIQSSKDIFQYIPGKSFSKIAVPHDRSKKFESLINRLQTLVNNIRYE